MDKVAVYGRKAAGFALLTLVSNSSGGSKRCEWRPQTMRVAAPNGVNGGSKRDRDIGEDFRLPFHDRSGAQSGGRRQDRCIVPNAEAVNICRDSSRCRR